MFIAHFAERRRKRIGGLQLARGDEMVDPPLWDLSVGLM